LCSRILREELHLPGDGWAYIEREGFDKRRSASLQESLENGIEKGIEKGIERGIEPGRPEAARAAWRHRVQRGSARASTALRRPSPTRPAPKHSRPSPPRETPTLRSAY